MGGSLKLTNSRFKDENVPFIAMVSLVQNEQKNLEPGRVLKLIILDWMKSYIKFVNFCPARNGKQKYLYSVDKLGNFSAFKYENKEITLLNFFPISKISLKGNYKSKSFNYQVNPIYVEDQREEKKILIKMIDETGYLIELEFSVG